MTVFTIYCPTDGLIPFALPLAHRVECADGRATDWE
jgi:hypothetical protein